MKIKFQDVNSQEVLKSWELNSSQEKFWNSSKKFILFSGGFGCGKTLMLILKAIFLSLSHPKNYILMGRKTYPELRDTLMKQFFDICPDEYLKDYRKSEGRVIFPNGSEIIFRHLDVVAESELRSLNLGAAFIDQVEDIGKEIFLALRGRLRRENIPDEDRIIGMSCNPTLFWAFADFKQAPEPEYELIEASTYENERNLPEGYLKDLEKYPQSWKRQFVMGIWDENLLSDKAVFEREYLARLSTFVREPQNIKENLEIWKSFQEGHRYQMGIDSSEGQEVSLDELKKDKPDYAAVTIVDLTEEEEVASWSGRVPPDILGELAAKFARWYQTKNSKCVIIPEMNSIGLALVNRLKQESDIRIFTQEEYDKQFNKKLEKLGWRTTRKTKPLLVARFKELLRLRNPKIRSAKTLAEFKSFIYTDEANKYGMGAQTGFHDDRLVSCLLAFWEKGPVWPAKVISHASEKFPLKISPTIYVKDGKAVIPSWRPFLEIEHKWTVN